MHRFFLVALFSMSPIISLAQEGTVTYNRAVKFDVDLPESMEQFRAEMPTESVTSMVLYFNAHESYMTTPPAGEGDELDSRARSMIMHLRMGSSSRSDQETLNGAYVNYDEGSIIESTGFMGRKFLIEEEQPEYAWKLTSEQSQFLGRLVQQATAIEDSTTIEVWYTPEIPVMAGPGRFGGLPGLILVVSVDDGRLVYSATEISLEPLEEGTIKQPENGQQVSRAAYEEIVAEKLEEVKRLRSSRTRDRFHGSN